MNRTLRLDSPHEKRREFNHYFIDESGTLALYGRGDRNVVGTDGCSKLFMLGALVVYRPDDLNRRLESLRRELLSDPAYNTIESMQPHRRKTALTFHAKDDHPSVRRRVFDLLANRSGGMYALVAIRRKEVFVNEMETKRRNGEPVATGARWENAIYDGMAMGLLRRRLHKADCNNIVFARRTKSSRTAALALAIETAKQEFLGQCEHADDSLCPIDVSVPSKHGGLQTIDYLLWALQRALEKNDWEAYNRVKNLYAHIHDKDAPERVGGVHYSARRGRPAPPVQESGIAL